MKTVGLIGGMSWESTIPYYRTINDVVKENLGGLHSARIVLYSVDFHEVERYQHRDEWQAAAQLLAGAARSLQAAGADFVVLCTNTMHKIAADVEAAVDIPLLHIADATAEAIVETGIRNVGLLGTRFTMEQAFYKDRLSRRHDLEVVTPKEPDRELVHRVIYDKLCLGIVDDSSRNEYRRIMTMLSARGAQGIILGCTEIALLVQPEDSPVPLFDTAEIHARGAANLALSGNRL